MQKDTINGQAINVAIIAADGTEVAEALQPAERDLLAKIDKTLKADPQFKTAHPGAQLVRIDSNRGLADRDEGRFYLRYQYQGGWRSFGATLRMRRRLIWGRGLSLWRARPPCKLL